MICGLFDAARALHAESRVFGFVNGPRGVVEGAFIELTDERVALYRNTGGFDMIRSGRDKIESDADLAAALKTVTDLALDGLVVIGGDDSNTNAAMLGQYFASQSSKTVVVGAPKTIDGDLKVAPLVPVSFGFHTATRTYSELIGNLCVDAKSSAKYYHYARVMGRSASHVALEVGLQTHANVVLISEEVAAKKMTMHDVVESIVDVVCKRAEIGKFYGVVVLPEGLIEAIPEVIIWLFFFIS